MDPGFRVIAHCDKCNEKILALDKEEFAMLKVSHYIFGNETYRVDMALCKNCWNDFINRWSKGG